MGGGQAARTLESRRTFRARSWSAVLDSSCRPPKRPKPCRGTLSQRPKPRARARLSDRNRRDARERTQIEDGERARAHRHKSGLRNDDLTPVGGRGHTRHPGSTGPAGPWFDSDVTAGTRT